MSLTVEVAGYGICQTFHPYAVMVICVQQEKFQAWTVYRLFESFATLAEHLNAVYPSTPAVPFIPNPDDLSLENLEACRNVLNQWLQTVTLNPLIFRTQSMYHFLCDEANQPPPFLEIHWRNCTDGSFDEMEMDDLFEKHLDDEEGGAFPDCDEDEDVQSPESSMVAGGDGWNGGGHGTPVEVEKKKRRPSKRPSLRPSGSGAGGDDDAIDIQAISCVEAEFIYDREEEESPVHQAPEAVAAKRTISLESFQIIRVIGKGSFGKVFLVRDKAHGLLHALKVLKKEHIIRKNQVEHTKTERSVLGYIRHPYIVGLKMAFQTEDKLFFVLDYCSGGELFFHLGKIGRFAEERARHYAAQITLALEYVHQQDIIYRDLKPENVLLDHIGNVRLTDFGLSKEGVSDHSTGANSFCGTPEYIAPEVLLRQGHGRAVDWWSLGALLYEMLTGLPPFYSRNRETMFDKIMKAELTFPPFMSPAAKDLLSKLLVRDPKSRLGSGERDAQELKEHPFFADVDWTNLALGRVPAPWTPTVAGSLDTSLFDQEFTSMPTVSPGDVRGCYMGSLDLAFEGFTFVDDSVAHLVHSAMAAPSSTATASSGATAATITPGGARSSKGKK